MDAAATKTEDVEARDRQAIEQLVAGITDAWNKYDSAGFAAPFTEDADFITAQGHYVVGRAIIEESHRHIISAVYKNSENHYTVESIRFPAPNVAVALLLQHTRFGEAGAQTEIDSRPTAVLQRQGGQWRIIVLHNTRVMEMPPAP